MDLFKRKKKKQDEEALLRNREAIAKALEVLFATGYIDKKRLYFQNFLRGMAFSAGGVIGATLVIGILLWILSLFGHIPLVGPLFENTRDTIKQSDSMR